MTCTKALSHVSDTCQLLSLYDIRSPSQLRAVLCCAVPRTTIDRSCSSGVATIAVDRSVYYMCMKMFFGYDWRYICHTTFVRIRVAYSWQWRRQPWGTGARAPLEFANARKFCSRSNYGFAYLSAEFS